MADGKGGAMARQQTLHDHIRELRTRLFVVALVFVAASAAAYYFKDFLIDLLLSPLHGEKLIYLNPGGGFSFIFQVTLYIGAAVAIPFLIFNLYRFVAPALPPRAQKNALIILLISLLLLIIGVAFGYIYAIPGALNFLNNFAADYINPSLTADAYLNFILAYTAGLGILFQLPLIMLFIHWIHPLTPGGLLKFERFMVLIAFVAAAIITPTPDLLNQCVIAAPIILMYQAGFIAIGISILRSKRRTKRADKAMAKQSRPTPSAQSVPSVQPAPVMAQTITAPQPTVVHPAGRAMDVMRPRRQPTQPPVTPALLRPASRRTIERPSLRIPDRPAGQHPMPRMSIDGVSVIM